MSTSQFLFLPLVHALNVRAADMRCIVCGEPSRCYDAAVRRQERQRLAVAIPRSRPDEMPDAMLTPRRQRIYATTAPPPIRNVVQQ